MNCAGNIVNCAGEIVNCAGNLVNFAGDIVNCAGNIVNFAGNIVNFAGNIVIFAGNIVIFACAYGYIRWRKRESSIRKSDFSIVTRRKRSRLNGSQMGRMIFNREKKEC